MENSKLERPLPLFCFGPFLTLEFVSDFEIRISDFSARDVRLFGSGSARAAPYRRLAVGWASKWLGRSELAWTPQIENLRNSRVQLCAMIARFTEGVCRTRLNPNSEVSIRKTNATT